MEVKAKDKFALVGMADDKVADFMAENYRVDADSAAAFVGWLRGTGSGNDAQPPAGKGPALETWHRQGDEAKGTDRLLSDPESAKARAAGAAPRAKKKK